MPVPADAEAALLRLDATYERAVSAALERLQLAREKMGCYPEDVHLVRYAADEDLARAHPDLAHIGAAGHAALIGRVREAIQRLGVNVRIVYFDTAAYHAWRGARPDNANLRAEWAVGQTGMQ